MKKYILSALIFASPAYAEETHAEYWERERTMQARIAPTTVTHRVTVKRSDKREYVAARVAAQARTKLGSKWVNSAIKIAHTESRMNPNAVGPRTKQGRAQGVMQVMPATARAMGFNPSRLRETEYGIAAGIEHMRLCILSGVELEAQLSKCHVAGVRGWKMRLNRRAERYKHKYVAMVMRAPGYRSR